MFWDTEDLNASRLVKNEPATQPIHANEAISVFGSTDYVVSDASTPQRARAVSLPPSGAEAQQAEAHQSTIPRLPVPPLEHTCQLYLKSLEGLLNAEEYQHSERCVEEFLRAGGDGEKLQKMLEEYEASKPGPSWLEGFWDEAYLCTRDSIPINVNYFFGFEDHAKKECCTQIGRAASLTHAAACAYIQVRDRTWGLDTERGKPLCMSQYRRVFCASRVPAPETDYIVTYSNVPLLEHERQSKTTRYENASPGHVVVLIRNRYYKMEVLTADKSAVLPMNTVAAGFARIVRHACGPDAKAGPPVGVFTTMNRDDWADARMRLVELGNESTLLAIQSALLVVVLDGLETAGLDELSRTLLHGPGTNRWFDRHNLIITHDGRAGLNFEHSVGDGIITLRIADAMYRADADSCLTATEVDAICQDVAREASSPTSESGISELVWRLDGLLDARMQAAFDAFNALIQSNETATMSFKLFGGDFIKRSGISPDAFVQIAFQLTHWRMFGRLEATYEAASTRGFLHGRTEVVRSVTRAVADFCEASSQPVLSRRINSKVPSQIELLRGAAEAHVAYMKVAKVGFGVDRHMLGLRRMCAMHDVDLPRIFKDPAFARSCHWTLSTSHCGSAALSLFGFGPVVADGFGLGYMIKNDCINCNITSKYTHRLMSSSIFCTMLESSLLQLKAIVQCDWEKRRAQPPVSLEFTHPTAFQDFEFSRTSGFVYKSATKRSVYS